MTLIQVKLTEEQDKKVGVYKAMHGLDSKAQAVAAIIDEFTTVIPSK